MAGNYSTGGIGGLTDSGCETVTTSVSLTSRDVSMSNSEIRSSTKPPESFGFQMERESLYLEDVDKKDKVFVGPTETVVHSPESDQKKGHLEPLVPAPSSLREAHPCGDNWSHDDLVEENEGLRKQVCQLETRWDEHGKVCPMSGVVGEEVKGSGFDCDEKPLTCSSIHEATSSLKKTPAQLESELVKAQDENQKLMEKFAILEREVEDERAQLKKKLSDKENDIASITERLERTQREKEQFNRELTRTVEEERRRGEEKVATVTAELESLKGQFTEKKQEARKYKNELSQAVGEKLLVEDELAPLRRELEFAKRDFQEKCAETKKYKNDLSRAVAEKMQLEDEYQEFRRRHRNCK